MGVVVVLVLVLVLVDMQTTNGGPSARLCSMQRGVIFDANGASLSLVCLTFADQSETTLIDTLFKNDFSIQQENTG